MVGVHPDSEAEVRRARERARRLSRVLCAAGLVSLFRAAALIVTSFVGQGMFWYFGVALAVLFPGCCGVAYCFLAARVARGSRADLAVSVGVSAILFVPYLLLSPFEEERIWVYTEALNQVPAGPLLDRLLYGAQMTAIAAHSALLGWIILAGRRLLRSMTGHDEPSQHPPWPSLWVNLLLVFVGFVVGYGWNVCCVLLAGEFGLRGQVTWNEGGPLGGSNDLLIVVFASVLMSGGLVGWQSLSRWRCWGLVAGALAGMVLSAYAVTYPVMG